MKVPNASPSAASYSSDINGWAVRHACEQLMERLSNTFERHHTKSWEEIISIGNDLNFIHNFWFKNTAIQNQSQLKNHKKPITSVSVFLQPDFGEHKMSHGILSVELVKDGTIIAMELPLLKSKLIY